MDLSQSKEGDDFQLRALYRVNRPVIIVWYRKNSNFDNELYDKGQYSEVMDGFEKYDEAISTDDSSLMHFYLGESLLAAGEYQRAAEVLETFNQRENALYEVARFHRALALILAGAGEKARRALDIIYTEKGPYREKAQELLKYFDDCYRDDEAEMPLE